MSLLGLWGRKPICICFSQSELRKYRRIIILIFFGRCFELYLCLFSGSWTYSLRTDIKCLVEVFGCSKFPLCVCRHNPLLPLALLSFIHFLFRLLALQSQDFFSFITCSEAIGDFLHIVMMNESIIIEELFSDAIKAVTVLEWNDCLPIKLTKI